MTLYNCKHAGDEYRISKFDQHMNVESSYLCNASECNCPAGVRPTCRHRQMLPKFIQRKAIDSDWMYDFDRGGWVQIALSEGGLDSGEADLGSTFINGNAAPEVAIDEVAERVKTEFAAPGGLDQAYGTNPMLTALPMMVEEDAAIRQSLAAPAGGLPALNITATEINERIASMSGPENAIVEPLVDRIVEILQDHGLAKPTFRRRL